jgi:hypothetical protein
MYNTVEYKRESFLGFYGTIGILIILWVWVVVLVTSFALLHWFFCSALSATEETADFAPTST